MYMENKNRQLYINNVEQLRKAIVNGDLGRRPEQRNIIGTSYICQSTRFSKETVLYLNYYLLMRVEGYFGVCVHTPDQLDMRVVSELSGQTLKYAICDERSPVRIAAMDAYLGVEYPHESYCNEKIILKKGTPIERAEARDNLIAEKAHIEPKQKVALIGVVNPLIKAIRDRGGECLPCDRNLKETQWGEPIEQDMEVVLSKADNVICTAMTLGNNTFDRVLECVQARNLPLTVYAQTGSAVAAQFVGKGITTLIAETFPFSQFSPYETAAYWYDVK